MPRRPVILIVDDEKNTRDGLVRALRSHFDTLTAENGDAALRVMADNEVDIMLSDIRMPGMDGIELLRRTVAQYPRVTCILLTAYGSVECAVNAMKLGATDFLMKPVDLDQLDRLLERTMHTREVDASVGELHEDKVPESGYYGMIGNSELMRNVYKRISVIAPTTASVFIQGPSGTGKELVARAIHNASNRKDGPFVAVHCAALTQTILESELFGHEQGAFTGAVALQKGCFERANGGTIFLDEISEIDASTQVKLLRVLEERSFVRVGGSETIDVDIRIVSASNRNLRAYVADGHFREDLYYRLNVVDVTLPSLHDRAEDIPLIANDFLRRFSKDNGKVIDGFTPGAMALLQRYEWPGNVRELRNKVEKMVVLAQGNMLDVADVPAEVAEAPAVPVKVSVVEREPEGKADAQDAVDEQEVNRESMLAALAHCRGNRTKAAKELGLSRRTFYRKLKEFGIENKRI